MATYNSVHVSRDLMMELQVRATAEGKTVDELAEEALRRHLAQRTLHLLKAEADRRRGDWSDAQVDDAVERAISDVRGR